MKEKVRFAPSPTGPLHIGGLKTALINYLYAKKTQGVFILRVEDTDQKRKVETSEDYIIDSLKWIGIWKEEENTFFRQSERKEIYEKYIAVLIQKELAYYAFDSEKELKELKEKNQHFKYNSSSRTNKNLVKNSFTLNDKEQEKYVSNNNYVIRLKIPPSKNIVIKDLIRGNIEVSSDELEDKVLIKKDGMPTYHFANVVDDYTMGITTVIRGEEWISSLPIHLLLYNAFDWNAPKFIHLPLILSPNGKGKLSKRHAEKEGFSVFPINSKALTIDKSIKESGILPEALINYLSLLGWNAKNEKEIFTLKELEDAFSIEGLQKQGAAFDYKKLLWVNQQHLKQKSVIEIKELYKSTLVREERERDTSLEKLIKIYGEEKSDKIIRLVKERFVTIDNLNDEVEYFIDDPIYKYLHKVVRKASKNIPFCLNILEKLYLLFGQKDFTIPYIKSEVSKIRSLAKENGEKDFLPMQLLRISLVGDLKGIDVMKIIYFLGQNTCKKRIKALYLHLKNY